MGFSEGLGLWEGLAAPGVLSGAAPGVSVGSVSGVSVGRTGVSVGSAGWVGVTIGVVSGGLEDSLPLGA